jgi:hypothetical protein
MVANWKREDRGAGESLKTLDLPGRLENHQGRLPPTGVFAIDIGSSQGPTFQDNTQVIQVATDTACCIAYGDIRLCSGLPLFPCQQLQERSGVSSW